MNTDFEVGSEGDELSNKPGCSETAVSLSLRHLLAEGLTRFLQLVKSDSDLLSPPVAGITGVSLGEATYWRKMELAYFHGPVVLHFPIPTRHPAKRRSTHVGNRIYRQSSVSRGKG